MQYLWFFFFNDPATTEIYTLSLHDALPILARRPGGVGQPRGPRSRARERHAQGGVLVLVLCACRRRRRAQHEHEDSPRSEEHTSELQSQSNLVCRLLLVKTQIKSTIN